MSNGIRFKYNPSVYSLTIEHKTPKKLVKKLGELLPEKKEFSVNNYSINTEKITISIPIQDKWRKYLMPENPTELDYILLFSDEVLLVLQSMYDGASKLLNESMEKLNDINQAIKTIKRELKKFEDYENFSGSVSTELFYYIDSYVKSLRQQLYQSKLMKSNIEKEVELYKLIMDSIYTITMKFVTSYPMITVEYSDEKNAFQLNVNDSFIDLPSDISNVRDVYTTYKKIFISALTVMKSDVLQDMNNYHNSLISLESTLSNYKALLEEVKNSNKLDDKTKKNLIRLLKTDIKFIKEDMKLTSGYIKKLKKIEKTITRTIKELDGVSSDE